MALQRTVWLRQILADFYASLTFLEYSQNWDEYVQEGVNTVTIPVEGAGSNVEVNRSSLPATPVPRVDTDISYSMNNYTSDPRYVRNLDQLQMSYDKMASVISQDMALIKQRAAMDILYAWRAEAAAAILRTTGATIAASAGASGTRKALKLMDLANASKLQTEADIPEDGRVALLTPQMILDLANDPDVKAIGMGTTLMNYNSLKTAPELAGYKILRRSKVLRYDNASTPVAKTPTANAAATDCEAGLLWHRDLVGRSLGNNNVYYKAGDPTFYGNLFSMEVNAGGRKASKSNMGVLAIVQTLIS